MRLLAEEGPELVQRLLVEEAGVVFDRDADGALLYTLEGGHSVPRVLHVGDATGRAIEQALIARLRALAQRHPDDRRDGGGPDHLAAPQPRSAGRLPARSPATAPTCSTGEAGAVRRVLAPATVLATGGLGRIYRYTTNPEGARGDGLAMAYRAGARVVNAEYVQFHPTTLAVPGADNFLISEAVRGEGGRLYTPDGRHFMEQYAPRWGDLAPRDVVARAIHHEMIEHGYPHVLLDLASHMDAGPHPRALPDHLCHLPGGRRGHQRRADPRRAGGPLLLRGRAGGWLGADDHRGTVRRGRGELHRRPRRQPPGQHLAAGGPASGATGPGGTSPGATTWRRVAEDEVPPWEDVGDNALADPVLVYRDRRNIQHVMWLYVGLARNARRLARALRDLNHLWEAIDGFYRATRLSDDLIGLRNLAQAAWVVTRAAWHNRQSRGAHFREDAQPRRLCQPARPGGAGRAVDVSPSSQSTRYRRLMQRSAMPPVLSDRQQLFDHRPA